MQKNQLKISVIMSAYNAQDTIQRAVESVLTQDLKEIELILVDDGSTDSTDSLLRTLAEREKRIRILHTPHLGPAQARNAGIQKAEGKYLFFLDSDDYIRPGTFSSIWKYAETVGAQLLIFGFERIHRGAKQRYTWPDMVFDAQQSGAGMLAPLYKSGLLNPIWNKLVLRSLVKEEKIQFQDIPYGEDRIFTFDILKKVCTVAISHHCFYVYCVPEKESVVASYLPQKFELCLQIDQEIRALSKTWAPINQEQNAIYSYMFIKSVISCLPTFFSSSCPCSFGEKKEMIGKILHNPEVHRQSLYTGSYGLYFNLCNLILRLGFVWPAILLGWGIATTQKALPSLYLHAQKGRKDISKRSDYGKNQRDCTGI